MKTLLAVLQLTLVSQGPVPGSEQPVSSPPSESKRGMTIDFEDDTIAPDLISYEDKCYPRRCCLGWTPLIRIRADFDDKVMMSVAEM